MTILYIEDEAIISMSVTQDLEDAGYKVEALVTCEDAFEYLRENPVDLLITDINTPGDLDGWDLALKAREQYKKLPVIYTTAFVKDPSRIVPGGVYISKPFTTEEIIATCKRLLSASFC